MIRSGSLLWQYLSPTQQQLAIDGQLLVDDWQHHHIEKLSDYSYLVFPFAKLFEGFLKQLLRDLDVISEREYQGAHFRVGKVLSPNLVRRLGGRSAYGTMSKRYGQTLADLIWDTWKQGRNLVFHYFPHNVRRLSFVEASELIDKIVACMEVVVDTIRPKKKYEKVMLAEGIESGVS